MLKLFASVLLLFCFLSNSCLAEEGPAGLLLLRIAPAYHNNINFKNIPADSGRDVFELETIKGKLYIRGNNYNSMATGLNHYLKYYCHTFVSWYKDDKITVPAKMPAVSQKIRQIAYVKNRFFLNYCTSGYTMPWWTWKDWERCIDWMALNGINMPLSTTGEEAIWYRVWQKFGLTDSQIRSFFTGPAYLPWHRMANIDYWEGPLPQSWINNQESLEKKIVQRERELNMKPVLPAFAGHVPEALKNKFPNAKINHLGEWGGFAPKYESNFLDPFDSLFKKIQTAFLEEQTKAFGTDHIYGADPFNEITPPNWDPDYLASVSRTIYQTMQSVDTTATWLQMTWLFYIDSGNWTKERIKAYLTAVPKGKMMLLDYYCENTEVWKLTEAFYGQPYIWCYLGNFGGNTMLAGNLKEVENRMSNTFINGGNNFTGIGSTLEGFDMNPVMYDFVFEKAWQKQPVDINNWLKNWAACRAGINDTNVQNAWLALFKTVYVDTAAARLGGATLTNAKPGFTGHGNWTTNPDIGYKNSDLLKVWRQLLAYDTKNYMSQYSFDVANIGRQVLGNYFSVLRDKFTEAYNNKDLEALKETQRQMDELFDDLDNLLSTQPSMLLGKWIEDARRFGVNDAEKNYFEKDARSIVTIWGGEQRSLNDYASRLWAGLTKDFYKARWQMFTADAIVSIEKKQPFNEQDFKTKLHAFEDNWVTQHQKFATQPTGNSIIIGRELYKKYSPSIEKSSH